MKELESEPGEHVSATAKRMVDAVKTEGDVVVIFNGICLTANQFSTVESICDDFDRLCELRQKEYRESPEGMKATRDAERRRHSLQSLADSRMTELPWLDFTDLDTLIEWLCDMEDPRDRIDVNVDNKLIQQTFIAHGFEPNAYTGDAFVKGDPEIEKRWLIGQAIADVYVPMVRHFASKLAT